MVSVSAVLAGDPVYASDINERIGTTVRTSDTSTVTTTETVADTVTVSLVAGRTYEISYDFGYNSSVAADSVFVRLREDSVSGNQLSIGRYYSHLSNGGGSRWVGRLVAQYTASTTGSKTFAATYNRASGTGNVAVTAGASYPTYLRVQRVRG